WHFQAAAPEVEILFFAGFLVNLEEPGREGVINKPSLLTAADDSDLPQDPHMVSNVHRSGPEHFGDLADVVWPVPQKTDCLDPLWRGQSTQLLGTTGRVVLDALLGIHRRGIELAFS